MSLTRTTPYIVVTFVASLVFAGCDSSQTAGTARPSANDARVKALGLDTTASRPRPIVVQGAMDIEVRTMIEALDDAREDTHSGYTFWRGTFAGYPVIVAKTQKGMVNAAASTALAIELYQPLAIINQGTSGGHETALNSRDIVLGSTTVNIGAFKTGTREVGKGSDFTEWNPMDLLRSDGSAGQDPNAWVARTFAGDPQLIAAAQSVRSEYTSGRIVEGVIGSSDMWNSELDRIAWLHQKFGTSVEEMEAAAAAQVASLSRVPFLGIRVLSNNITNGAPYVRETAVECQQYVLQVVRAYAARQAAVRAAH